MVAFNYNRRLVPQLDSYLCYTVRYDQSLSMGALVNFPCSHLPISVARAVVHTLLGIYVLTRLVSLIAPGFLSMRHRIGALMDTRTIRAVSLLISEVLLIVPSVHPVGVVDDCALFTVGALLVLGKFISLHSLLPRTNKNQHHSPRNHQVSVIRKA